MSNNASRIGPAPAAQESLTIASVEADIEQAVRHLQPAPRVERSNRQRTVLRGIVVFGAAPHSTDCVIRDLSVSGAKIRLAGADPLPKDMWLVDISRGLALRSQVIWQRGRDVGLTFLQSHDLAHEHTPDLALMRALWVERLPR